VKKKTKNNEEQRVLELRSENFEFNDNDLTVSGYVNKAGDVSKVIGKPDNNGQLQFFYETIDPQAFIDSINNRPDGKPIDLYADHDPQKLLATTDNGSLELNVDDVGLHMSAHIVNTSDGRDAYELIKSGIMGKMSFGFNVRHANMDYSYANAHQYPLRKVDSLDLMEVSAVRFPAYLDTNIEARNSQEAFVELEKRGFNVSNFEFDTSGNGEDNLNMNFEEMKSDEIRSLIEHGKQELEKREDAETKKPAEEERSQQSEAPQEKAVSSSSVIVKFDEGVISQLSEIRSALTQLVPKKEAPAKEDRDEDDLDTDADKQAEEKQKGVEKPEEKSSKPEEKSTEDDKEEARAKCESEDDKKEDRAKCESEDMKDDKTENRSLPSDESQQPPLDQHQQEINSIIGSLKELFH
jgi:HK97 family phage prohead protease